jgi:hypothetical protein
VIHRFEIYQIIDKWIDHMHETEEPDDVLRSYNEIDVQATMAFHDLLAVRMPDELIGQTFTIKVPKEGENVSAFNAEFYDRQAAEMLRKAELVRGLPQDDDLLPDGTIMTWQKQYYNSTEFRARSYQFVALKQAGHWFVTGQAHSNNKYTWSGLMNQIGLDQIESVRVLNNEGVPLKEYVAGVQKALEPSDYTLEKNNG